MEKEISTDPIDFEESLILTHRIGLWNSNSIPKTSQILNKCRKHHTAWIFCFHIHFYSIVCLSDFPFHMGGTVQKWDDPKEQNLRSAVLVSHSLYKSIKSSPLTFF